MAAIFPTDPSGIDSKVPTQSGPYSEEEAILGGTHPPRMTEVRGAFAQEDWGGTLMFGEGKKRLVLVCEHEDPFSGSSGVLFNPLQCLHVCSSSFAQIASKRTGCQTVFLWDSPCRRQTQQDLECFPFSFFLKLISFWRSTRNDVQTQ